MCFFGITSTCVGALRSDVLEGVDAVVLEDLLGRDLSGCDLAEEAVAHMAPVWDSILALSPTRPAPTPGELLLHPVVAAVQVVDPFDRRFALRGEPASTSAAEARRSLAMTEAPVNRHGPSTTAQRPSRRIFAPMRPSSATCWKRFSKTVSVTVETPSRRSRAPSTGPAGPSGSPGTERSTRRARRGPGGAHAETPRARLRPRRRRPGAASSAPRDDRADSRSRRRRRASGRPPIA